LIGFAAGAVMGALRDSGNKARRAVYDLLENSMQKHDITVQSLRQAIQRSRKDFSRVEMALNTIYGTAEAAPAYSTHAPNVSNVMSSGVAANQNGNIVCGGCRLTNFSHNSNCRRCGAALQAPI
jgi:hypothetical protein